MMHNSNFTNTTFKEDDDFITITGLLYFKLL